MSLLSFYQQHPTTCTLVGYYVLSAAIGSLPAPQPTSHLFYQWFFKFSNTLAGNLTRAFSSKLPSINGAASQQYAMMGTKDSAVPAAAPLTPPEKKP